MRVQTVTQEGHVAQMRREQESVSELTPLNEGVRYQSGILIFSPCQKLVYVNRRALELTGHLDQAEIGTVHEVDLAPVRELWKAIRAALEHRRAAHIWEPFELKRLLFEMRRKTLLRGLGLADRNSHDDSRIVIVLEELGLPQDRCEPERPVMRRSQGRGGAAILGSAQLGSDRGVFDTSV
jgi:PAS domain-containing protein